jgi:hypothetical protein
MKGLKGNKRRGTHTSTIDLVETLTKTLSQSPYFESIRLGKITTGSRANGEKRIKITLLYPTNSSPILLKVKDNSTLQECTVFTKNTEAILQVLKKFSEKNGVEILESK